MWDSFKENVQSRFSSRTSLQHPNESTQNYVTKDAMKNVVTPHSIPQFIVPPLDPGDLINSQEGVQSSGTSQSLPNSENPMRSSMQRLSLNKSTGKNHFHELFESKHFRAKWPENKKEVKLLNIPFKKFSTVDKFNFSVID